VFQQPQPQFTPPPADDDADDEQPAPNVAVPPNRGPVFNTFPQQQGTVAPQGVFPQMVQPPPVQPGGQPAAYPSAPAAPYGGVAVPGMVAPAPPAQPGQLVQPGQPQPVPPRRPGGE
jgi:hypothetical protein